MCRRFDGERIFFDRESIESGDVFPERLRDGVGQCKALLALIAPDWLEVKNAQGARRLDDPQDFVCQEIALALSLGKKIIPILFDDTPMPAPDWLPQPLKGLASCDALTLRGKNYEYDTQLAELVRLLAQVPGMPAPRPMAEEPGRKFLRFAEDLLSDYFAGRDAELAKLEQALPRGKSAARVSPVAIYGMGGSGKTQLALKFALDRQDEYAGIWWFRAERPELLETDFEAFCFECGIPRGEREKPFAAATRWLAWQPRWLLVFDNADTPEHLRPYLKPFKEQRELAEHHLLITSRNPSWSGLATLLEVRTWNPEQGAEFLESRLAGRERNEMLSLADRLGGLPLALEQAAPYIDETGTPVTEYLDLRLGRHSRRLARQRSTSHRLRAQCHYDPESIDRALIACGP